MVGHAHNQSIQKTEAGRLQVQGQSEVYSDTLSPKIKSHVQSPPPIILAT
jgi:hypothetical protein